MELFDSDQGHLGVRFLFLRCSSSLPRTTTPHTYKPQPFTIDRPAAAVDPSLQLTLALAMATVEKTPARAAVDNAEAYLLTEVGWFVLGVGLAFVVGWVGSLSPHCTN